jgi:hypothetical protein
MSYYSNIDCVILRYNDLPNVAIFETRNFILESGQIW